ncbi:MAG: flavodoxin [Erysipelotrichaceae bacterium]|nr:flavodoxin [Erysipelotrichaceae bacterium]
MNRWKTTRMGRILSVMTVIVLLLSAVSCAGKETVPETSEEQETNNGKVIVVYFSHTGNTEKLAEYIAERTSADSYRIEAKDPYTEEDTRYDADTRAYREQHDSDCRPEIAGKLPDLNGYDVIFLGYPIWHGEAPKIVYTFLDNVDVSGKRIIPFCTSASSPVGMSAKNLESLKPEADWDEGIRLEIESTAEDIEAWLNTLGLAD